MDLRRGKVNIIDRPLSKGKGESSVSAYAFLFSELVQYCQNRVQNISDLEKRLEDSGYAVGLKILELVVYREKGIRRESRLLAMLQFVVTTVWKNLFGKAADALERSTENEDEYMIREKEPLTNKYISVPPDLGQLNCAAYIAGIIKGVLGGAGFGARVSAITVEGGAGQPDTTVFLVKFSPETMKREAFLSGA